MPESEVLDALLQMWPNALILDAASSDIVGDNTCNFCLEFGYGRHTANCPTRRVNAMEAIAEWWLGYGPEYFRDQKSPGGTAAFLLGRSRAQAAKAAAV